MFSLIMKIRIIRFHQKWAYVPTYVPRSALCPSPKGQHKSHMNLPPPMDTQNLHMEKFILKEMQNLAE